MVEADPIYASADIERQQTNDMSLANSITLATERLAGINDFLLGYIAANVTADDILAAVDLQLAVETMLTEPASAATVRSLELIEEQLAQIDLTGQLATFLASQSARTQVAAADLSGNGLAITLANSALLEGDAYDLLVLRNSAAPHLVYDLVGNLRVDGGVATTCWLHPAPASSVSLLLARQLLNGQGVSQLAVSHCEESVGEADLVVLRRGDFLALPPSVATPLVAAFEDGRFAAEEVGARQYVHGGIDNADVECRRRRHLWRQEHARKGIGIALEPIRTAFEKAIWPSRHRWIGIEGEGETLPIAEARGCAGDDIGLAGGRNVLTVEVEVPDTRRAAGHRPQRSYRSAPTRWACRLPVRSRRQGRHSPSCREDLCQPC